MCLGQEGPGRVTAKQQLVTEGTKGLSLPRHFPQAAQLSYLLKLRIKATESGWLPVHSRKHMGPEKVAQGRAPAEMAGPKAQAGSRGRRKTRVKSWPWYMS